MSEANERNLPNGWAEVHLRDVLLPTATVSPGKKGAGHFLYIDIEAVDNKRQLIVSPKRVENAQAPSRAKNHLDCGDVLFCLVRPYLKNIALITPDLQGAVGSTAFCVCRPASGVSSRFVFNLLRRDSFIHAIPTYGSSPPAARDDEFLNQGMLLPPPEEQERIADALDELLSDLDAGVAALERVQAKLKHYRAAVLKAAVEGALTTEWRQQHPATEPASALLTRILAERRRRWEEAQLQKFKDAGKSPPKDWKAKYQEPLPPNTASLPLLPKDWCWVSLDQLARNSSIGLDRGLKYQRMTPPGSPYVKMNNVTMDGRVFFTDMVFVETTGEELERYSLVDGDLLFNTRNSKELVGKVGIIRRAPAESVYNNNLMRIRFDGAALPAFVCFQMCAGGFRSRMEKVKKATTSVAAVYAKDLFPLQLALPPLAEQEAIVEAVEDQLSVIEHLEADLAAKLKSAQALRQSILRHAFTGQLVPQDPNDEPAAELLKRIAAERVERARQAKNAKKPPTTKRGRKKADA